MLRIDPIVQNPTVFQAKPTSAKLAGQKIARFAEEARLPEALQNTAKKAERKYEFVSKDMSFMTKPKAQVADDITVFMAKLAPKEYATTSAKLAEQKARRLNVNL